MEKLKNFLKTNRFTKKTFEFISKVYHDALQEKVNIKKRHSLQEEGMVIIEKVQNILERSGYTFFFDMGTLLGIVREGRLLKHDMDIDLAVVVNNEDDKLKIKEILLNNEIKENFRYTVEELGIVEQSFIFKNVKFDINYYYHKGDFDECYLMFRDPKKNYDDNHLDVVKLLCPHIKKIQKIHFNGIKINVPGTPENYLAARYGDNWRIPDKKYIYWKGPSTQPTDYIGYQTNFEQK